MVSLNEINCSYFTVKSIIIILTCSKALAVYVTRTAAKVPSFMAFLKTSEKQNTHRIKAGTYTQSVSVPATL